MIPRSKFRLGLAAKLAICVVAGTAVFFAAFGYISLHMQRTYAWDSMVQTGDTVTDVIVRGARFQMLREDRESLHHLIQDLGAEPNMRRIRIFNKDGRITLSTDEREIGKVVDKQAEQCVLCHSSSQPLEMLDRNKRAREFTENGVHTLGVMRPIYNAPDCSSAACHVHEANQRVLGVIDANLSLSTVDRQMAEHQRTLTWFLLCALAFGCAAAVMFIWVAIYKPVKALINGTRRVANGDLDYRLPVTSEDELGDLALSFNKMTGELAGVQAKIEEEVRRKTAELERVHKSLLSSEKLASIGKLAATVAHEINNPLFGILTYARLVLRGIMKLEFPDRDELAEQLRTIERESKRCGDLVKNLLTFSRQAPSHREPVDLNTVVSRAILLIRHKLDMQSIELEEALTAGLPPVYCDANQIQQVVLVLMVNASEAMPKGGSLRVTTQSLAPAEQCVVRVKDTGCGIPEDVLPNIFDPFFTTKEDQNRTGLGLAVAASIVEQHGGEILVSSTPGEGTEFTVALPAGAQQPAAALRPAETGGQRLAPAVEGH